MRIIINTLHHRPFLYCCLALVALVSPLANAQRLNSNWKQDLNKELQSLLQCKNTVAYGINSCNKYLGSALKTVYEVNDFYDKDKKRYMRLSEIFDFLNNTNQWELLGKGYESEALTKAQDCANSKKAVVAIYMDRNNDIGNLAIILPGELTTSGSWGIRVPNCSSFLISQPSNSFVNKGLSYAFRKNVLKDVMVFAKKY